MRFFCSAHAKKQGLLKVVLDIQNLFDYTIKCHVFYLYFGDNVKCSGV